MNIVFIVFPDVHTLDLTGTLEVFSTSNSLMTAKGLKKPYKTYILATNKGKLETTSGMSIYVESFLEAKINIDTIVVVGGPGVHEALRDSLLKNWLLENSTKARRIISICSGAFLLADCGLLDGKKAVTHWSVCDELALNYPSITVDNDPIFIQDGNIWTSAGVTSGIDLALTLVHDDIGYGLALEVAQNLVVPLKRSGGQKQFSTVLSFQKRSQRFSELNEWIINNLTSDLSVKSLAFKLNMSERSFIRHYKAEIGISPGRAVEHLRVDVAKNLLLESKYSIKKIAIYCGYGSHILFERHFLKYFGVKPQNFRINFSK